MNIVTIRQPHAKIQPKHIEPPVIGAVNVQKNCIIIEVDYNHRTDKLPLGRRNIIESEAPQLQCN